MPNFKDNYDDDPFSSTSTLMTSKFGYASTKLIHSIEKNLYIVLAVIVSIATLSLLNTLGILSHLYSENVDYFVDVILSIVLIAVVAPLVYLIVKSRRVLDNWNDMFERNTISTSLIISMANRSKQEVLKALAYSLGEIGEPLQTYMESNKSDMSEFLDVNVNANLNLKFDVLIDPNQVVADGSTISNNLKEILRDCGSVAVKVIDGTIDRISAESFVDSLTTYTTLTKNDIGLGLIIGDDITEDAQEFANKTPYFKKRKINNLLLIAKPLIAGVQR